MKVIVLSFSPDHTQNKETTNTLFPCPQSLSGVYKWYPTHRILPFHYEHNTAYYGNNVKTQGDNP